MGSTLGSDSPDFALSYYSSEGWRRASENGESGPSKPFIAPGDGGVMVLTWDRMKQRPGAGRYLL